MFLIYNLDGGRLGVQDSPPNPPDGTLRVQCDPHYMFKNINVIVHGYNNTGGSRLRDVGIKMIGRSRGTTNV